MKKPYIKPTIEKFLYQSEEGFARSIALYKDYVLIEGNDGSTRRTEEEITEITNDDGEYITGSWE